MPSLENLNEELETLGVDPRDVILSGRFYDSIVRRVSGNPERNPDANPEDNPDD
jgi:hypothetical protein